MKSRVFNQEEISFILENYKKITKNKLVEELNLKFNKQFTFNQIQRFYATNKLRSGISSKFTKNNKPWNKGTKGIMKANKTSYKKGQSSHNTLPIGTESETVDGYLLVKVSHEGAKYDQWKLKHKILWEKERGQIPEDYCLIFLDGNRKNIEIENLMKVEKNDVLTMNRERLFSAYPELTWVGVTLARLKREVREYERNDRNK